MAENEADLKRIKELIQIMEDNDLLEVEICHGDDKIHLKRSGPHQPGISAVPIAAAGAGLPVAGFVGSELPAGAQQTTPEKDEGLVEIKSPIVGTFYERPSPDSDPYVEVDSHVKPQTVVCIIEAMKVMNEIKAEADGVITEVLVKNGQAVEYGQVLFKLRPD